MRPSWLTDEQHQLREMLLRLTGDSAAPIEKLAELGIMGATILEDYGGLGFGTAEAIIIAEALGRGRSTVPFLETSVLGGGLIATLGSDEQKQRWLPAIAEGRLTIALAFAEGMHLDPVAPRTEARADGTGYVLNGTKTPIRLPGSGLVLLSARHGDGMSLHIVEPASLPMGASFEMVDGVPGATIELRDVWLGADTLLGKAGEAFDPLRKALQPAIVVQAAEQVGIMAHLINATIDYLKQRQQFGQPLAKFQVLQHRVADMMLAYEKAASMVTKARLQSASLDGIDRRTALGAAVMAAKGARFVGHEAIQLHGGMGVTEELSIGPAVKRLYALETRLASTDRMTSKFSVSTWGKAA
jgi:alkylation response protein AidB-like acyl-CoA dehydrogenase